MALTASNLHRNTSGRTAIVITRATVFRGRPVSPGDEFDDVNVNELAIMIGCGKARVRQVPSSTTTGPAVETASIEPRTETAAVSHAVRAPRRRKSSHPPEV